MEPNKIKDSDPLTTLFFPRQLNKACDSNGVPEGVTMWLLLFFLAKSPAASLTIRTTPRKGQGDFSYERRKVEG